MIPEIKPCKNTPQKVFVPKIGERIFKLIYEMPPITKEAHRLWKKVLEINDSFFIKSNFKKRARKIRFMIVPQE